MKTLRSLQKLLVNKAILPGSTATSIVITQRACSNDVTSYQKPPKVLITGSLGQLGSHLAKNLRARYGPESVIMSDVSKPRPEARKEGPFVFLDVCDLRSISQLIVDEDVDWLIHYAVILSSAGESNVQAALKRRPITMNDYLVNFEGVHNVLEAARMHNLKLFIPSTIGAFGPETPKIDTPDITLQRPRTIYGVSKVNSELLGEYYNRKFNVDFRSLRFPGIMSADLMLGSGGTTDYSSHIFHGCIKHGKFDINLQPHTALPMMYIDDCTKSVVDFLHAPAEKLTQRTYNVTAMSFTPEELVNKIWAVQPDALINYDIDPTRLLIAESWPRSLDDSIARSDWGWSHDYGLEETVKIMYELITKQHQSQTKTI